MSPPVHVSHYQYDEQHHYLSLVSEASNFSEYVNRSLVLIRTHGKNMAAPWDRQTDKHLTLFFFFCISISYISAMFTLPQIFHLSYIQLRIEMNVNANITHIL